MDTLSNSFTKLDDMYIDIGNLEDAIAENRSRISAIEEEVVQQKMAMVDSMVDNHPVLDRHPTLRYYFIYTSGDPDVSVPLSYEGMRDALKSVLRSMWAKYPRHGIGISEDGFVIIDGNNTYTISIVNGEASKYEKR